MKKFILLAVCAVCAMTVSAQRARSSSSSFFSTEKADQGITFGLRAGLNLANMSYSSGGYSVSPQSLASFHVGVVADIPLMESLYIQSGLFLQNKGCKQTDEDYGSKEETKSTPMYLEIPVLASYRYHFSESTQLQINFGPYFAYGIGGKWKYTEWDDDGDVIGEGDDDFFGDDGDYKKFDCGLHIGAGITLGSHYYLGVAYQFGLSNIIDDDDFKVKNNNLMVSVGYNF